MNSIKQKVDLCVKDGKRKRERERERERDDDEEGKEKEAAFIDTTGSNDPSQRAYNDFGYTERSGH